MSIYPVPLNKWFPKGDEHHSWLKFMLEHGQCLHCKKRRLNIKKAWGHHSLPWGHGDAWCSERHLRKYFEKERRRSAIT